MNRFALAALSVSLFAPSVYAAGLELNAPNTRVLFEEGSYLEFSAKTADPELSGSGNLAGTDSGDLLKRLTTSAFAFKTDVNDDLAIAVIYDEPYGSNTDYPTGVGSSLVGSSARVKSRELALQARYRLTGNAHAIAGVGAVSDISAEVTKLPAFASLPAIPGLFDPTVFPYTLSASGDRAWVYTLGAAYEKPEIALRVALTYQSEATTDLTVSETLGATVLPAATVEVELPDSVNLEFQTGIMADTLLFGSVRWVDWSEVAIDPAGHSAVFGSPLLSYENDWTNYTLGLARRLSDQWAASISASYEPAEGGYASSLGPVDGRKSLSFGLKYSQDAFSIAGGVSYVKLGGADIEGSALFGAADPKFSGGKAWGFGVRVGYHF